MGQPQDISQRINQVPVYFPLLTKMASTGDEMSQTWGSKASNSSSLCRGSEPLCILPLPLQEKTNSLCWRCAWSWHNPSRLQRRLLGQSSELEVTALGFLNQLILTSIMVSQLGCSFLSVRELKYFPSSFKCSCLWVCVDSFSTLLIPSLPPALKPSLGDQCIPLKALPSSILNYKSCLEGQDQSITWIVLIS